MKHQAFRSIWSNPILFALGLLCLTSGGQTFGAESMATDCRGRPEAVGQVGRPVPLFVNRKRVDTYDPRIAIQPESIKKVLAATGVQIEILSRFSKQINIEGIDSTKSLLITDQDVLEQLDLGVPGQQEHPVGRNTFAYLMAQLAQFAPRPFDPSAFVLDWLGEWRASTPNINGWRRDLQRLPSDDANSVVKAWRAAGGALDTLPFRLLAVVNRVD